MCFLLKMCFWSGCLFLPLHLLLSPGVQVEKQHLRNPELSPLACLIPAGYACCVFSSSCFFRNLQKRNPSPPGGCQP